MYCFICEISWRGIAWRGIAWRGIAWRLKFSLILRKKKPSILKKFQKNYFSKNMTLSHISFEKNLYSNVFFSPSHI